MNILQDKKKLKIAIGAGVAVIAVIIGIAGVSMRGKKKLDNSPKVIVEPYESSTDLDKKTANGLSGDNAVSGSDTDSENVETESFDPNELSDGQGYAYPNGDAETIADNSPEEKMEETADVSEINDPNLDEVVDEEGDGFEYEVDTEMEKQDAEAEKQVSSNLGGSGEGLTGNAATDYIFNELAERDRAQEEMAARSGIGQ